MAYSANKTNLGHAAIFMAHHTTDPTAPMNTRENVGFITGASFGVEKETLALDVHQFGEVKKLKTAERAKITVEMREMTAKNFVRAIGGDPTELTGSAVETYLGGLFSGMGEYEVQICAPKAADMSPTTIATTKCDEVLTIWRATADEGFEITYDKGAFKMLSLSFTGMTRNPAVPGTAANLTTYRRDTPGSGDLIADLSATGHGYEITES